MRFKLSQITAAWRTWRLQATEPVAAATLRSVRSEGLTYLDPAAILDLYQAARAAERANLQGAFVEAGTARGGSALVLALAKTCMRPLLLFDAFERIPPPTAQDGPDAHARYAAILAGASKGIGQQRYYGYEADLIGIVTGNFRRYGHDLAAEHIDLVKGYYEETLRLDQPVALAHLDCDWYDSVLVCLERITPYLVPGGRLIVDDYQHWSGCRRAVDTFFAGRRQGFTFEQRSRLHIVRN